MSIEEEIKILEKIIDLEKPMHFTKEQSEWIKAYVIVKKQEARADAIDDVLRNISLLIPFFNNEQLTAYFNICDKIVELKEQK